MDDLLSLLREYDLPPYWDGLAVVWDGWDAQPAVFLCPPPRTQCCERCGSIAERVTNRGRVARVLAVTHDSINAREEARDRLPASQKGKIKRNAWYRLTALRCPDCRVDVVADHTTGETWVLDHTDYGPDGSHPPGQTGW